MAIFKHISSKNGRYSDAVDYLTKQYDKATGRPILDEYGQMIERDEYLITGINCTPESFAALCISDSIRYHANRSPKDIKTHQYIISYDPADKKRGLTIEAAMKEGVRFAKRNFPGHRVLVVAHPDGRNGSGNIHVHIIVSALRYEDREPQPSFMRKDKHGQVRKAEYKAGYKHRNTAKWNEYLFAQVQDYCRENGYTVAPKKSAWKTTNREYMAMKAGQNRLDEDNKIRSDCGLMPVKEKFVSAKNEIRLAILDASTYATSLNDFNARLRNQYARNVEVRGDWAVIPYRKRTQFWTEINDGNREWCLKFDALREKIENSNQHNRTISEQENRSFNADQMAQDCAAMQESDETENWNENERIRRQKEREEELLKNVINEYHAARRDMLSAHQKEVDMTYMLITDAQSNYNNAIKLLCASQTLIGLIAATVWALYEIKRERELRERVEILRVELNEFAWNTQSFARFQQYYSDEIAAGRIPGERQIAAGDAVVTFLENELTKCVPEPGELNKINQAHAHRREVQKKMKLLAQIHGIYDTAAKLALRNDLEMDARECLNRNNELCRLLDGYWTYNVIPGATMMVRGGTVLYRANWRMMNETHLRDAKAILRTIERKVGERESPLTQPQIREEPFPIDVKISQGVISFRHPDQEQWIRGKSLGTDFELESIMGRLERNREQSSRESCSHNERNTFDR